MFSHYLMFGGNCAEALETYSRVFDAQTVEMQRYGDVAAPGFTVAQEQQHLVLHARLRCDGTELMCADSIDRNTPGTNMYVSVTTPDEALVRRVWDELCQDGHVYMELTPSFFAAAHGSLRDRYGINWMFTALRPPQ